VAKPGECYKIRRKWRGPFLIHKLSSHNVFLYNPSTDKYVKKSVHITRIKPCFQRDDIPEDDEVIEECPIVEVTYPPIRPQVEQVFHTPEMEIRKQIEGDKTIDKLNEPTELPSTSQDNSMKVQQGGITTDTGSNKLTDDATYEDANPFWTALKIVRQNTSKGKTKYLIKWANPDYPDTWTDTSNVTDEPKRRFYLTHTKTGTKRKTP